MTDAGIKVSMDGRGRWMDNVFIERLWCSLKYECVYLHAFETDSEARAGMGLWMDYYNIQWRQVADQLRPKVPKLATLLDEAEDDVLAYMTFPREHRAKIHSTYPIERLNREIKRRAEVVGIFPNEATITKPVGAVLLK